jgi:hypothetical protein
MAKPKIKSDGRTITVRVPIAIRKRGGRKVVLSPSGASGSVALVGRGPDNAMMKALARAFRWREMLEAGTHATITDLARAERIDHSYVGRILRLTLLAPDIVETILNGQHSEALRIETLSHAFPICWNVQRKTFQ